MTFIIITIKFVRNNTKHAIDNDTNAKPRKTKIFEIFQKNWLKCQNILLVESISGEATPKKLNENAVVFLLILSPFNAHIMLNSLFEENKLKVSVPPVVATLFLHGIFSWVNSFTPAGLTY